MNIFLTAPKGLHPKARITITGSKSESNRLLILQAHFPSLTLSNLSNSDDTRVLMEGLKKVTGEVDIHHAGTAMRFLTAYFSAKEGTNITLTGSQRMKERPIGVLVKALRSMGANIEFIENEGFPPLKITGRNLQEGKVTIPGNISSQFISALILIGPTLENGLTIHLETEPTSVPYLKMTLQLLSRLGVSTAFSGRKITVAGGKIDYPVSLAVESDWSSASYFYSILALSPPGSEIVLSTFRKDSLQGDSRLAQIYSDFGVETEFQEDSILLRKVDRALEDKLKYSLVDCPDLAQTIAACCLGLGIGCELTGLHTLKIKETDRLSALKNELSKLGGKVDITDALLHLEPCSEIKGGVRICTYNDHRMAMAFAPLALKTDLVIEDAEVVSKSYPDFWEDLATVGITVHSS